MRMALRHAVAYTELDQSREAGKILMERLMEQLAPAAPDFVFVFSTIGHDLPEVVSGIRSVHPGVPLCGCTGAGVLSHLGSSESTHALCLMGLQSAELAFHPFLVPGLKAGSFEAGEQIGRFIRQLDVPPDDEKLLFLFPDSLVTNFDQLSRGILSKLDDPLQMVGGGAGNDFHFAETMQICNDRIANDAVAGVLVSGRFRCRVEISHGMKPIGPVRTVTRATDNIVHEIDGQRALDVIASFMGIERFSDFGQAAIFGAIGQAFEGKGYAGDLIIRAMMNHDSETGSITFSVPVPEGSRIQIVRRDQALVLDGTGRLGRRMTERLDKPDEAAYFYFNCGGRGMYLFGETEPDVAKLAEALGGNKAFGGFFSFFEIGPVEGENHAHSFTGVLVGIEA